MTIQTTQVSIRLSAETVRQLMDLQNSWGENRSQVIIRCIERTWIQHSNLKKSSKVEIGETNDAAQFSNEVRS